MPVEIPSVRDVEQAFEGAVRQAAGAPQPLDDEEYKTLFRGVMAANWQPGGSGVETLQAVDARLFRVTWPFRIDRIADGQKPELQRQAAALRQALAAAFAGGTVAVAIHDLRTEDVPGGTLVGCCAHGIAR